MSAATALELAIAGIAIGCIYSLIALGLTMVIRATGILHFAQGEVVMLGAMCGIVAHSLLPMPILPLVIVGMVAGGLAGVILELVIYRTLRVRGIPLNNVIIATIGVSIILQNGAQLVWGAAPIAYPKLFSGETYAVWSIQLAPQLAWIIGLGLLAMLLLQLFLMHSRAGRAMQAAAQDPTAARLMGINLTVTNACTFGIGGILGGGAGVLLGSLFYSSFNMGFLPGVKAFVAAALGGLGSVFGAMVGGVVFGLIETFTAASISTAYKDGIGMLLLITVLLFWPSGFAGAARWRR